MFCSFSIIFYPPQLSLNYSPWVPLFSFTSFPFILYLSSSSSLSFSLLLIPLLSYLFSFFILNFISFLLYSFTHQNFFPCFSLIIFFLFFLRLHPHFCPMFLSMLFSFILSLYPLFSIFLIALSVILFSAVGYPSYLVVPSSFVPYFLAFFCTFISQLASLFLFHAPCFPQYAFSCLFLLHFLFLVSYAFFSSFHHSRSSFLLPVSLFNFSL